MAQEPQLANQVFTFGPASGASSQMEKDVESVHSWRSPKVFPGFFLDEFYPLECGLIRLEFKEKLFPDKG